MTITFESFKDENYVHVKWTGDLSSKEIIEYYKYFHESSEWAPGMNELIDLSLFDFKNVTSQGLMQMAEYSESVCKNNNISHFKSACHCPQDVQKGMVHAFSIWADESPELVKIFNDLGKAKEWLVGNNK